MERVKRTRLISFRLSEEEYQVLTAGCSGLGARSVSDLLRALILEHVSEAKTGGAMFPQTPQELQKALLSCVRRIVALEQKVRRLGRDVTSQDQVGTGTFSIEPERLDLLVRVEE